MHVSQIASAYAHPAPSDAGRWVAQWLGFDVLVDLGWYVSTAHPDEPSLRVDFVAHDHDTWAQESERVAGAMLALVVDDVDAQHERCAAGGVDVLMAPRSEPWGQRRTQLRGPAGLLVELVQAVPPDPAWMAEQGLG